MFSFDNKGASLDAEQHIQTELEIRAEFTSENQVNWASTEILKRGSISFYILYKTM